MGHAPARTKYKCLPYKYLPRDRRVSESSATCILSVCIIPDEEHANSCFAHLFINDAGDINMVKEDAIGKFQCSVINTTFN
jgi:hypothetical protein